MSTKTGKWEFKVAARRTRHVDYHCRMSPTGAHWWLIEEARGSTSTGVCKFCGEQREFYNDYQFAMRDMISWFTWSGGGLFNW